MTENGDEKKVPKSKLILLSVLIFGLLAIIGFCIINFYGDYYYSIWPDARSTPYIVKYDGKPVGN